MKIIDGQKIAQKLEKEIKKEIKKIKRKLSLAIILVGKNPASEIYISKKEEICRKLNINCKVYRLPSNISQNKVINLIKKINNSSGIDGILIQLPLPSKFNTKLIFNYLNPLKDVDGLSPLNLGLLLKNQNFLVSPTAEAILEIIKDYKINLINKKIVLVGYSDLIGKPLSLLLIQKGATITICHSRTKNLAGFTSQADILITAVGKPKLIKSQMVKKGVIIIDAGINKVGKKIVGDVDFENVKKKAKLITPVPGGVGPITIMKLLNNLIKCAIIKKNN